ncbi:hypothetical protein CN500_31940 [Bacillus cereus]|nr:hypothetical protein CN500_31940 [Bacillus cereus]
MEFIFPSIKIRTDFLLRISIEVKAEIAIKRHINFLTWLPLKYPSIIPLIFFPESIAYLGVSII